MNSGVIIREFSIIRCLSGRELNYRDITLEEIRLMLEENERDRQFGEAVTTQPNNPSLHPINKGLTTDNIIREMMLDVYQDGFTMQYPDPVGVVILQPQRKFFYRGESEMYPTTMSSLGRILKDIDNAGEREAEQLVAHVKCLQFAKLIQPLENVRAFEMLGITVQYEAIAQHYGFKTFLMDMTSDFEVALFFACCKFENGRWHPLTLDDTEEAEEKKYGLIFQRPVFPWSMMPDDNHPIFPIGYQPFIRCSNQTGYTIPMMEGDDLKTMNLPGMQLLRFRHNPKLSQWIYDKMEGGNKIYSKKDVLSVIGNKLDSFIRSKVIDDATLDDVLCNNVEWNSHTPETWKQLIRQCGYTIGANPLTFTPAEEAKIAQQLAGFDIEQFYGIKLKTRMVYNGPTIIKE